MSRATLVYILMLAAGAGGLWFILRAGAGLAAPTNLSGAWAVGGEDASISRDLGGTVFIEQSGRYFRLKFEQGLQIDLELVSETRPDPTTRDGLELKFEGRPWSLTALGPSETGPLIFRLNGPADHTFTVSRGPVDAGRLAAAAAAPSAAGVAQSPTADAGQHAP